MKKITLLKAILIVCLQLGLYFTQAQILYSTTFEGGTEGNGTINKFIPATNNLIVEKSFERVAANPQYTHFIEATDGKLYGMTYSGGVHNAGVIFSFDPVSSTYFKLKDFDSTKGAYPQGSLVQASDGKLYGLTLSGGRKNVGVIFSFDPSSLTYIKLKDFDNTNGASPHGSLVQASDGKLYGMTGKGGDKNSGVIFSFDPSSAVYTKVKDLDKASGTNPYGSLVQANDGKLYGMTQFGGSKNEGTIFSLDTLSSIYTKLWDFSGTHGGHPLGSLIQAGNGKLYGITNSGGTIGGGVIFSFDPSALVYKDLKSFRNPDGINPNGSLIQASNGKLYGMTFYGDDGDVGLPGNLFSFDISTSEYKILKLFDDLNFWEYPKGSPMQASDGKLYGMITYGGAADAGAIFSYDPVSSNYKKLRDFGSDEKGLNPSGSLIQASDGKLYGMTVHGGNKYNEALKEDPGVIFKFDPATSACTKLSGFDYSDGDAYGSLVEANDGKLYGLTSGRSYGNGIIFSFDPGTSSYKKLVDLYDVVNGAHPFGSLIQASDGKLYGITKDGGTGGYGVVFLYDPITSILTKILDFDSINGAHPYGSLIQAGDGKLYGLTSSGGSAGKGVIFSVDIISYHYTKVMDFDGANGERPTGSFLLAGDGKLFGMTSLGGSKNKGVIFSYDLSSSTYKKLKDFDDSNGAFPLGNLMQHSDGKLYGVTSGGGSNGKGVVFSYDPTAFVFVKLKDYNGANGANPYYGSGFVEKIDSFNKAPVVRITAPADSAVYQAKGNILLKATATDPDGSISKVAFYNGFTLLQTVTVAPYTFTWTNVPAGTYSLTAKATDNAGKTGISLPVTVIIISRGRQVTLYSATSDINNYRGVINKFIPAIYNLTVEKPFQWSFGHGDLTEGSDGKLYAIIAATGGNNRGSISSYDPSTSKYTTSKQLDIAEGGPYSKLTPASNGKLYGQASQGGEANSGVIFSYDPTSSAYKRLYDFKKINGGTPAGDLVQAKNGKLYGITSRGGRNNFGVIFGFDPVAAAYAKLYDLDSNANSPTGGLAEADDGKLYGMLSAGGAGGSGLLFSFDPVGGTFNKLKDINKIPVGSLLKASDGKLYAMIRDGGKKHYGAIFSYDPSSAVYAEVKEFNGSEGRNLNGTLVQAGDGKLYGMTTQGGENLVGTIFSFEPLSLIFAKIYDLGCSGGCSPYGGLTVAGNGKLYGIASSGGVRSGGTFFSFDPAGLTFKKLWDFGDTYSQLPSGSLTEAHDGKLYGMTHSEAGFYYGPGTIFSFDRSSSTYQELKYFDGKNGDNPYGSLLQAGNGKLYGVTPGGGSNKAGVIFSFDPSTSIYTRLKSFTGADGRFPAGSLIQAANGKLYGITKEGGANDAGVIFSYDPVTSAYAKIKDFDNVNGAYPWGSLLQATNGKLYGMTYNGGSANKGVIFNFDPATSVYTKLKDFDGLNGAYPYGSFLQANNGKLYGLTSKGGISENGVIFSFDPASSNYTKLKDFDKLNGSSPYGNLMQASDGILYGMTNRGGNKGYGVAFSYDLSSSIFKKLKDYDGANGANPYFGSSFIEVKDSITKIPPAISILTPDNNATYFPGAIVKLTATASDADATISKVEFYNNGKLLYLATDSPYAFKWEIALKGDYIVTAKATDKDGLVAISDTIHIKVVPNKPPMVSIIKPSNGQIFAAPVGGATINIEAVAADSDGSIAQVSFYNGAALLTNNEHKSPYTYQWQNVPAGTYSITAVAKDNWGAKTTSSTITITVLPTGEPLVSNRSYSGDIKTGINDKLFFNLLPNPARNIVDIDITELPKNRLATLSVISSSGVVLQTKQLNNSTLTIQLNISSLASGVYIIKMISGDKIIYRQFVKL